MTTMDSALHYPTGQSLHLGDRPSCLVPPTPLPSLTFSTTSSVFSLVSHDPETSPYAAVVASSGPMAKTNPIRFSTKWWDDETGLGWWGMRYFHPDEGKWISRDPLPEILMGLSFGLPPSGFDVDAVNAWSSILAQPYGFVDNSPASNVDALGLDKQTGKCNALHGYEKIPDGAPQIVCKDYHVGSKGYACTVYTVQKYKQWMNCEYEGYRWVGGGCVIKKRQRYTTWKQAWFQYPPVKTQIADSGPYSDTKALGAWKKSQGCP